MDKQQEFVLRTIEERGVKFIRLWFTDVAGTLKSVAVAPAEIEGAFAEGDAVSALAHVVRGVGVLRALAEGHGILTRTQVGAG